MQINCNFILLKLKFFFFGDKHGFIKSIISEIRSTRYTACDVSMKNREKFFDKSTQLTVNFSNFMAAYKAMYYSDSDKFYESNDE